MFLLATHMAEVSCINLPQPVAREALQILNNQIMVSEYCEKCLSPIHRLIGIRSTGIVCNEQNLCRILINGEKVDVFHLFAPNHDREEENFGYAVGFPKLCSISALSEY